MFHGCLACYLQRRAGFLLVRPFRPPTSFFSSLMIATHPAPVFAWMPRRPVVLIAYPYRMDPNDPVFRAILAYRPPKPPSQTQDCVPRDLFPDISLGPFFNPPPPCFATLFDQQPPEPSARPFAAEHQARKQEACRALAPNQLASFFYIVGFEIIDRMLAVAEPLGRCSVIPDEDEKIRNLVPDEHSSSCRLGGAHGPDGGGKGVHPRV
jgi:hypothetical protein